MNGIKSPMKSGLGLLFALLFVVIQNGSAQVDTLCNFTGEQHIRCASTELMEAIRAYEDTLSDLTGSEVHDIYVLRRQQGNRVWYEYDCDSLGIAIGDLVAQIEAARVPAGSVDPCSNFLKVSYYGTTISCLGSATGERDYLDNCWFGVNLQTTQFANGDDISEATTSVDWQSSTGPAYALYRDSAAVLTDFGLHYNPMAILDSRKLCPPGWTLPDSNQVNNLQTWASEFNQLENAQRRGVDGTWAPFESVHLGGEVYENQPITQFYALAFSEHSVADSLPYFANNSSFNSANPVSGRYLGAQELHGVSVRCRRMSSGEIEEDPYYLAWAATPHAQSMEYPSSYYAQMPHVRSLSPEQATLRGEVIYTGPGAVSATGFKWGNDASLTSADSVTAETHSFPPGEWAASWNIEVLDSIFDHELSDLVVGNTYFYAAWAQNNFGYSFGDTVSFVHELPPFNCGVETVSFDGYDYPTVSIGEQCWFQVDLRTTTYSNGDPIPGNLNATDWENTTEGAQTVYGEGVASVVNGSSDETFNLNTFGRLYNWAAVNDSRGLCPSGWHVATDNEWQTLEVELGMASADVDDIAYRGGGVGSALAASGTDSPSWVGTNSSQFSALPNGVRVGGDTFDDGGDAGTWWTSTAYDASNSYARLLVWNLMETVGRFYMDNMTGRGVRCILNTPESPSVSSLDADDIGETTATLNGQIDSSGDASVTEQGFIWGLEPDLSDGADVTATVNDMLLEANLTGLTKDTTYYFSAYATSSAGTAFGDTLSFATLPGFACEDLTLQNCGALTTTYLGHQYQLVGIGTQCWFAENLQALQYVNGDPIVSSQVIGDWAQGGTTVGQTGIMDTLGTGADTTATLALHGRLYNWHAAVDERGVCPSGWIVPSSDDWDELYMSQGLESFETGIAEGLVAAPPAGVGTNASCFNILMSGVLDGNPTGVDFFGERWYAWSTDAVNDINAYSAYINSGIYGSARIGNYKEMGFSIRCLKADAPTVSTDSASGEAATSATLIGTVVSEGGLPVAATGFFWGEQADLSDGAELTGSATSGVFTGLLNGLTAETTYYFSAFAANPADTTFGDTLSFTTLAPPTLVETIAATGITETTAGISGTVLVDEITGEVSEAGFVWGASSDLSDGEEVTGTYNSGAISASITSLDEGTNYYYIAFIADDNGRSYGDTMVFRTGLFCSAETLEACGQESLAYQGVEYNLVGLGDQCWFRDNLRADNYTDGTPIARNHWLAQFDGYADEGVVAYWGEGYPELDGIIDNSGEVEWHGYLYNAYAVQRPEGLCPEGWHVPSLMDLAIMEDNLPTYENSEETDYSTLRPAPFEGSCFRLNGWGYFNPGDYHFNDIYQTNGPNERLLMTSDLTPPPFEGIVKSYTEVGSYMWKDERQLAAPIRCLKGEQAPKEVFACGHSTVSYGGYDYETVLNFDGSCWFRENLRTATYSNGDSIPGNLNEADWLATNEGAQSFYEEDSLNLSTYGRLYNHYAIRDERGICPSGWHVSSNADWDSLIAFFGGSTATLGHVLKSFDDWNGSGGFDGLPAGYRAGMESLGYQGLGFITAWWADQETPKAYLAGGGMELSQPVFDPLTNFGYSVRCVKAPSMPVVETRVATDVTASQGELNGYLNYMSGDEAITEVGFVVSEQADLSDSTVYSSLNPGEISGGDDGVENAGTIYHKMQNLPAGTTYYFAIFAENAFGRVFGDTLSFETPFTCGVNGISYGGSWYSTVQIGDDCWMSGELKTTIYRDGTPIPDGLSAAEWTATTEGARSFYAEDDPTSYAYNPWGPRFYNWMAVNSGQLCPKGYRMATDEDWTALESAVSGDVNSLMQSGIGDETTNTSGFTAIPLGSRDGISGAFSGYYQQGYYWTATDEAGSNPWYRKFDYEGPGYFENPTMLRLNDQVPETGMMVRCLKE